MQEMSITKLYVGKKNVSKLQFAKEEDCQVTSGKIGILLNVKLKDRNIAKLLSCKLQNRKIAKLQVAT